jgi:hypothetical protein
MQPHMPVPVGCCPNAGTTHRSRSPGNQSADCCTNKRSACTLSNTQNTGPEAHKTASGAGPTCSSTRDRKTVTASDGGQQTVLLPQGKPWQHLSKQTNRQAEVQDDWCSCPLPTRSPWQGNLHSQAGVKSWQRPGTEQYAHSRMGQDQLHKRY